MKKIAFSVGKYELKDVNDSQFSKLRLYICHDMDNKNGSFLSYEAMQRAESTLVRKPIIMKMNRSGTDFEEHEYDTVVVGYIPEKTEDNNIHYEEVDGRIYLVADAIIWKHYSANTMEIFNRDGEKGISMEIQVLEEHMREDGLYEIDEYAYLAVCLLGDSYNTGMWNTNATVLEFSNDDNSVDLIDKQWSCFVEEKSNKEVKEMSEEVKTEEVVTDKIEEVVTEEIVTEPVITEEVVIEEVKTEKIEEVVTEEVVTEEVDNNFSEDEKTEEVEEVKLEETVTEVEEVKTEVMVEAEEDEEEKKDDEEDEEDEEDMGCKEKMSEESSDEEKSDLDSMKEEMSKKDDKILEMNQKINDLNEEIETLRSFKENIIKEENQAKMTAIFSKLSSVLSKEEIDNWKEKADSYEDLETFENHIKSFACDKLLSNDEKEEPKISAFSKMAVDIDAEEDVKSTNESVWDKISRRVSK